MADGDKVDKVPKVTQSELDDWAASLDIHYAVLDNLSDGHAVYRAALTLCNKGDTEIRYGNWAMYFSHIRMIEPGRLPCDEGILLADGLHLTHINGCLFRLEPTPDFSSLQRGQAVTIPFRGQYCSVARSDILPNWFLTADDLEPKVIVCTAGEGLDFVAPFDVASKWKRFDYTLSSSGKRRFDLYDPFTPERRFKRNAVKEDYGKAAGVTVLPTPVSLKLPEADQPVDFKGSGWTVVYDPEFKQEAEYLSEKIGSETSLSNSSTVLSTNTILLSKGEVEVTIRNEPTTSNESYHLTISASQSQVQIRASQGMGIFWGVQTLISLVSDGLLRSLEVKDCPRYKYRGMHVDVSRNFHNKESVLRLLEVMALYKLNKFHFHLTDDEGWRLEIPGLEELTEVGSKRCHSTADSDSLLPLLGSGPHATSSGTGFFSIEEYREILRFATRRHIEVIPEIDMPGHCHAAVKAMQTRYRRLKAAGKKQEAEQYLLSDLSATINADNQSVQMFSENSLNPGLPSTFEFVRKVISEIQKMHSDICPLRVFHFGGDEVPYAAWEDSPACQALVDVGEVSSFRGLMEYFVFKVAEIAADLGLEVGAWQDGVVHKYEPPFPRKKFPNKDVMVYAWKNVWETGMASDVYKLANSGYQVILSQGTHLYFDHPQEPDPEERGLYWACRYTDTLKVFCFAPDNLFSNADVRLSGEAFTADDLKALTEEDRYIPLEKPENIVGLQGQLWTELVRTSDQFDSMIYPRLLALAERAWHEGPWECRHRDDSQRQEECGQDWALFSSSLGHKELPRLDKLGVEYYLPPPGARVRDDSFMEVNCQIIGLPVQFTTDNGEHWTTFTQPVDISKVKDLIVLRTCSADGKRYSRQVKLCGPGAPVAANGGDR